MYTPRIFMVCNDNNVNDCILSVIWVVRYFAIRPLILPAYGKQSQFSMLLSRQNHRPFSLYERIILYNPEPFITAFIQRIDSVCNQSVRMKKYIG